MKRASRVHVRVGRAILPTYVPAPPDRNPMFLETRVYQGSSGRVYPLPFTDRISEQAAPRAWTAVWLENEFLEVMILPEIGGRIHALRDKTNGYDAIFRQDVIKPALVGLAGPWISGGIEFNWPQHHRPGTFLPVDFKVESARDGSVTVWCGDHDPMCRLKGMHGICLRPGQARVELQVRVYNRTPLVQTFLWWANAATRVHEGYQSFFPTDVRHVADHARRAMTRYPRCPGHYYGVDYGRRGRRGIPAAELPASFVPPRCRPGGALESPSLDYALNDLTFYANIPVPTSYMCVGSREDFFGGYDHLKRAGIVHVANHHLAPGKKQWTWGNHEFGYAWDRNLTDPDPQGVHAPYIELMAGVYTDNQPDFSFLQPGETKAWTQYWYPIREIGPAQQANADAAISLQLDRHRIRLGVCVTSAFPAACVRLERRNAALEWDADLAPGRPFIIETRQAPKTWVAAGTRLCVLDRQGREIISYQAGKRVAGRVPPPATAPPPPDAIASVDELFVTGLHLDQYRHATCCPTRYWREALRRDPLDARCNNAMGLWHLRRGEFPLAETRFRKAIARLTRRNANPYDGEPFYHLGLCLRFRGRDDEADDALYKATWNQAWAAAAYLALAEIDGQRAAWSVALEHLNRSLRHDTDHLRARNLKVMVLRLLGHREDADALLRETLTLDPLDWWARFLRGETPDCDGQTALDLALDLARGGFHSEAVQLLARRVPARAGQAFPDSEEAPGAAAPRQPGSGVRSALLTDPRDLGTAPLLAYCLGWLHLKLGDRRAALARFREAADAPPDYCFPARLEEIAILEAAMAANPGDARAPYYLGNLLYDRRRHEEAIRLWERSVKLDPGFSVAWRNLGIGYYNVRRQAGRARAAYERAFRANPRDARLLLERDQLWKRCRISPSRRLRELESHPDLVRQRDDLTVEFCALCNQTGQHLRSAAILESRRFQPWEGGEGQALEQHVRTHVGLGRAALEHGDAGKARDHFARALTSPPNLGESWHLLANQSDVHYWLGRAEEALGDRRAAKRHFRAAAAFRGDFQEMKARPFSAMTFFSALAWSRLGQRSKARTLLQALLTYARKLARAPATIDYFATSLPTMLLFHDDLQSRQETTALFLEAQAHLGLGRRAQAAALLRRVLRRDPSHALAEDLLRGVRPDGMLRANP